MLVIHLVKVIKDRAKLLYCLSTGSFVNIVRSLMTLFDIANTVPPLKVLGICVSSRSFADSRVLR